jgi:hypothetical protein
VREVVWGGTPPFESRVYKVSAAALGENLDWLSRRILPSGADSLGGRPSHVSGALSLDPYFVQDKAFPPISSFSLRSLSSIIFHPPNCRSTSKGSIETWQPPVLPIVRKRLLQQWLQVMLLQHVPVVAQFTNQTIPPSVQRR